MVGFGLLILGATQLWVDAHGSKTAAMVVSANDIAYTGDTVEVPQWWR